MINIVSDGITPFVIGGMQRHTRNLVLALREKGLDVHLFHPDLMGINESLIRASLDNELDSIPKGMLEVSTIPWHKFAFPGGYILSNWIYSRAVAKVLRRESNFSEFTIAKGFTCLAFEKELKFNVNFHGYEMFQRQFSFKGWLQSRFLRVFVRRIHQRCENYFSYGPGITRICRDFKLDRMNAIEISGAVDDALLIPPELIKLNSLRGKRRFLFIGRDERRKGLQELLQAWENLNFPAELSLVGPTSSITQSRRGVTQLGQVDSIQKLKSIIDDHDVLICASWSEGMPNVIMEAMARGLAVIATDVGTVSELVNNRNGILLPSVSVEGIVEGVTQIQSLTNEELLSMKLSSRERMNNHTWKSIGLAHFREINQRCLVR